MLHNWSTKFLRGFLLLLVLFSPLLSSQSVQAQWTQMQTFPNKVSAIEFLKFAGSELTGFVGLANGEIWRTTTMGAQWTAMTSPADDEITGFTFKDKDIGWASFKNSTDGNGGVLKTVDGGATWTVQSSGAEVSAVYYHAPGTRIFRSHWGGPPQVSLDEGANWVQLASTNDWNGYSFWTDNVGMVSNHVGAHNKTTNGGFTWEPMTPNVDAWRPLAIPNTNMGFIASQETNLLYRTYDRGATWETVPGSALAYTGHIEMTCAMIWVQTENQGLFYSTTHGDSWINVVGPNQTVERSFEISNTAVWAAEESDNSLWKFDLAPVPPPTKLRMTRGPIRINSNSCVGVDSAIRIHLPNFCESFQLTNLELTGSPDFSLKGQPILPYSLMGRDSLLVTYTSPDASRDSGYLKITYTVGGNQFDTTILIIGTRTDRMAATLSYKSMSKEVTAPCTPLDTIFTIKNTPCDPLRLVSATLLDSSIFRLQTPGLPYDLGFDEVATIRIMASASMQGTYTTKMRVRFLYAGKTVDTLIDLSYRVKNGPIAPNVILPNLILDNPCTVMDTVLRVVNKMCETISIDSVKIVGDGIIAANQFPIFGAPTDILRLPIRIQGPAKGKYTVKITLSFTTSGGRYDTTYTVTFEVKNDMPRKLGVPASFVFRSTSICAPREEKIYIDNILCDPVEVTQQQWSLQDPTITIVSQPAYPVTLQPGQKDSVVLRFAPTAAGNVSAGIKFDYKVENRTDNATTNITGIGTAAANANISNPQLVFDSAYSCEATTEQFTHMVNEGCDSITIVSMRQLAGNEFELVEPTSFPIRLGPGDSVMIRMRSRNEIGALSDSVEFTYRSLSGGADQAERLAMQGYTRPPVRVVELEATAFVFDSIAPCSTKDTTIWLYTDGICDTLSIDNVSASGLTAITASADLPKRLAPRDSMAVRISMNTGTGGVNGSSTITISGPGFDTTITIAMTTAAGDCGNESTLSFGPIDSTFSVEPCGTENSTITVTAQGDQPFTIGKVSIEAADPGQTEFKFVTAPTVPDVLNPGESVSYTVQFDASGVGNQQAFLVIESEDGTFTRRIPLSATINGVTGTMAVALQPVGGAPSNRKIGETVSVALFADLDVTPAHDLEKIEVDLTYDRDMLSESNFTSPSGWTVNHQETPTGAHLTFTKDMTVPHNKTLALGEIEYTVTLAENITTTMGITGLTLNSGDPDYVRCRVRPTGTSGSVSISVDPVCHDSTIRNAMAGRTFASIIAIKPSSVVSTASISDVRLEYITQASTPVTITVQDQLGRVVLEKRTDRSMGIHTESLELPSVEGIYFVTLQTKGSTETRKLMLQR